MNKGDIETVQVSAEPKALNLSFVGDPEGYAVLLEIGVRLHLRDTPSVNTTFQMWAGNKDGNLRYLYPTDNTGTYSLSEEIPPENGKTRPRNYEMPATWAVRFQAEYEARQRAEERAREAEERLAGVRGLVGERSW